MALTVRDCLNSWMASAEKRTARPMRICAIARPLIRLSKCRMLMANSLAVSFLLCKRVDTIVIFEVAPAVVQEQRQYDFEGAALVRTVSTIRDRKS